MESPRASRRCTLIAGQVTQVRGLPVLATCFCANKSCDRTAEVSRRPTAARRRSV
jgi:hypothetical protein